MRLVELRPLSTRAATVTGGVEFTEAQWEQLQAVFPDGVCDCGGDGDGEVARSATWLAFGDDERGSLQEPATIQRVVARSRARP